MELYILRHAIAAELGHMGARTDAERPLTAEGRKKMRQGAAGMLAMDVRPDSILSSPLVRTLQTAEIVAEVLGAPLELADGLAPGCTLDALRRLLTPYLDRQRLMIVGHEPDLSTLTSVLIGGGRIEFKKAALARVDLSHIAPGAGTLIYHLAPALLRQLAQAE
jgi:phosphohistidine phosphatase